MQCTVRQQDQHTERQQYTVAQKAFPRFGGGAVPHLRQEAKGLSSTQGSNLLSPVERTCWDSSRLKIIRQSKEKSAILGHNCPALRTSETVPSATLAETGVHCYSDSHTELGTACGNTAGAGTLEITDPGNSDVTRSMPEHTGDKKTKKVRS